MEREERYIAQVRAMGHAEVLDVLGSLVLKRKVEGWEPGRALEFLVLRAFELEGAEVVWPYVGMDEQVDGCMYVDGLTVLIECKDWVRPVDVTPLARLKLRLDMRPPGVVGLLFSRGEFTKPAEAWVLRNPERNLLLWSGEEISLALEYGLRAGLRVKWRRAVERGELGYVLKRSDFQ
jgi:hypothetical protein